MKTLAPTLAPVIPLKVTVAALTFRRPDGLRTLLHALGQQELNQMRPYILTVLIVDNDAAGSGRLTAEAFSANESYQLIYVIEPRQGIPMGRNRAMDDAPDDTDLFLFIDDDEWPAPGWLDAMLTTRNMTGTDIVHGPVEPVFSPNGNPYFIQARVFADRSHLDGERIDYAASNNVMMDFRRIRAAGIRFDERMRFTGGEDFLFFNQASRMGFTISWSDAAIVFDGIPATRMTWKWALQRQFRIGNTFAVAARIQDDRWVRSRWLGIGLLRMGLGLALLPMLTFSPRYGWQGIAHLLRGAGIVVGMFGLAYEEYSPARLATA